MSRIVRIALVAVALPLVAAGCRLAAPPPATTGVSPAPAPSGAGATASTATAPAYAYYYLWWSSRHWRDKLGPSYPYSASPLPLPATLGSSGCPPTSQYPGNQLTDVPAALVSQDDPAVIERDVRLAADAGLAGFLVNWNGTGLPGQTTQDSSYSRRLASMVAAVHHVQAEGTPFHLWMSLKASATIMTTEAIRNDLDYLARTYAADAAFDRSHGGRILLVWNGSRKYPVDTIRVVSARFRGVFFLVGDETAKSWPDGRATSLDGDAYYWSSQDPYRNPASFGQLQALAAMVRGSGPNPDGTRKLWLAPFAPGYDSLLIGGSTCVPRNDGATMRALFRGNSATNPDGWTLISWNEVAEGTYVEPLQRYGGRDLAVLRSLLSAP